MHLIKKYKKLIAIIAPFLMIFLMWKNLPTTVAIITKIFIGTTISSKEINFVEFGTIEIKDLVIKHKGIEAVESDNVKIKYTKEGLKKFRVKEILVEKPYVNVVRDGANINFLKMWSRRNKKKKKDTKVKVPIGLIKTKGAEVLFTDISYSRKINKKINDVSGYVSFSPEGDIQVEFKGSNKNEIYSFSYNNLEEISDMRIVGKNVNIIPELVQYGYDDKEISGASGKIDIDLNILGSDFLGYAVIKSANVIYDGLDGIIENINGRVDFKKDEINVNLDYEFDETPGKMKVSYSENSGVRVDFKFKDISYDFASHYKLLGNLKLPLNKLEFKSVNVALLYEKTVGFKAVVDYSVYPLEVGALKLPNLNGNLEYKDGILNLNAKNLKILIPKLRYKKNTDYSVKLDFNNKDNLKFEIDSNLIKFDGDYKNKIVDINYQSKNILKYNIGKRSLEKINLPKNEKFGNYEIQINVNKKNEEINFEEILILDKNQKNILKIFGILDLKKLNYNFNMNIKDFKEKEILSGFELENKINFVGDISGEGTKFIAKGNVSDLAVKGKDFLASSYVNFVIEKNNELKIDIDGGINKIKNKNLEIEDIKIDANYKNGILGIKKMWNGKFLMNGKIDMLKKDVDLNYNIKNFRSREIYKSEFEVYLNNVNGYLKGKFENLIGEVSVKDAYATVPNGHEINLNGDIKLKDNILFVNKFKMNNSYVNAKYDISSKIGNFALNIEEEAAQRYYYIKSLEYNILSTINGKIDKGKIVVNADIELNQVKSNENVLPDISSQITYTKNLKENLLVINNLNFNGLDSKKIVSAEGSINLKEKEINLKIPQQTINLKNLNGIITIGNISTTVEVEGKLSGELDNPKYSLKLFDVDFKSYSLKNIELKLTGDKNKIEAEQNIEDYSGNKIYGKAEYEISSENYSVNMFSKNMNLNVLNDIVPKNIASDISGNANFNISLSNDYSKNKGEIEVEDVNLNVPKALLKLKNANGTIEIDNEKVSLNSINGYLNEGKLSGKGHVYLPTLDDVKMNKEIYKELEHDFNLSLKNAIYSMEDYFEIKLSTDLQYTQHKVLGDIVIKRGKINKIAKDNKNLIFMFANFLLERAKKSILDSNILKDEVKIMSKISHTPELNINLRTAKKGIVLDIDDVSNVVQYVKGTVNTNVHITGKNEGIKAIGNVELINGSFVLGNEDFSVMKANIVSDSKTGKIIEFNPDVSINISGITSSGNVDLGIQGNLNNLILKMKTNKGVETRSLRSMLSEDEDNNNEIFSSILASTLGNQISGTILNPISRGIQRFFNISKFRIVTNILNQEMFMISDDPQDTNSNIFDFGARVEAENAIYKNKYFWMLQVDLASISNYNVSERNNSSQIGVNSNNQFDFKIERRYNSGWSYGVGVSKPNSESGNDEKKLNYYVDFIFKRTYNSIGEIFF